MFGRGARLTALSSLAAANLYVVSSSSTANSENINTLTNVNISTCAKTDKGIKHQWNYLGSSAIFATLHIDFTLNN